MYAEETHAITEDHQGVAANGEPSKHVDVHDEDTMSARNTGHPQEVEYDHLASLLKMMNITREVIGKSAIQKM